MSGTRIRQVSRKVRQRRTIVGGAAALLATAILTNSGITLASWTDSEQLNGGGGEQEVGANACRADSSSLNSSAWSSFLAGQVGGQDLATVAQVEQLDSSVFDTLAQSNGNERADFVWDSDIAATLLNGAALPPLGIDIDSLSAVGAYTQWTNVAPGGEPHSATGAVSDAGALELDDPNAAPPATGVLRLSDILQGSPELQQSIGALADLEVRIGAIDSFARYYGCQDIWNLPAPDGASDYLQRNGRISELSVALTSGAVADSYAGVDSLLRGLQGTLNTDLDAELHELLVALGLAGSNDGQYISIDFDLAGLLAELQQTVLSDDALTVDLTSGEVVVDLQALTNTSLRDVEPNTTVLGPDQLADISAGVLGAVDGRVERLRTALATAFDQATISIDLPITVELGLASVDARLVADRITLGQLADDANLRIELAATVSGLPVDLDALGLNEALVQPLLDQATALLSGLRDSLQTNLLANLTEIENSTRANVGAVFDAVTTNVGGLVTQIAPLVHITANVQGDLVSEDGELPPNGGAPTLAAVSALRIELLDPAPGATNLADVWLGTSAVGPVTSLNDRGAS